MKKLPPVVAMTLFSLTGFFTLISIAVKAQTTNPLHAETFAGTPRFIEPAPKVTLQLAHSSGQNDLFGAESVDLPEWSIPILEPIAETKYHMEVTLLTLAGMVTQIPDRLELRYSQGHFGRSWQANDISRSTRHHGLLTFEDTRIRVDVACAESHPYAGIKIVLPFGN